MKMLSFIPAIAIGSIVTIFAVFAPNSDIINSNTEVEMTQAAKQKKFKTFIKNFENIALPYNINQSDFTEYMVERKNESIYNHEDRIAKDYKAFVPGLESRFSRMGPNVYLYEAVLANENDYATVIYSSHAPYRDYPEYLLVNYDNKGTILSTETFAHRSYDGLIVGSIDKDKSISIKTYKFDYEDEDIDYEKTIPTSKLHLKNVVTLKVNKKGKLEDTSTASIDDTNAAQNRSK